jgi:hypothetical protein
MKRPIYIVRQTQLSDGGILQQIFQATKPGAQKMQFPYELPTVNVSLTDDTKRSIYTAVGIMSAGFVIGKAIEKLL